LLHSSSSPKPDARHSKAGKVWVYFDVQDGMLALGAWDAQEGKNRDHGAQQKSSELGRRRSARGGVWGPFTHLLFISGWFKSNMRTDFGCGGPSGPIKREKKIAD
jgi:hypothetical protein